MLGSVNHCCGARTTLFGLGLSQAPPPTETAIGDDIVRAEALQSSEPAILGARP